MRFCVRALRTFGRISFASELVLEECAGDRGRAPLRTACLFLGVDCMSLIKPFVIKLSVTDNEETL